MDPVVIIYKQQRGEYKMAIVTYKPIKADEAIRLSSDKEKNTNVFFADEHNQLLRVIDYKFSLDDLQNVRFFEKKLEGD